ncbi:MAG: M20/M25/M40 family metallo-hydrolase [Gemmatimonadales bacterium]
MTPRLPLLSFGPLFALVCGAQAGALATALPSPAAAVQGPVDLAMAARIREEGLERSRALELYRTLTDEIGPRLTGSPGHDRAAAWARDRFAEWGLSGARLEPFEFGPGWALEKLSIEMTSPFYMPLTGYPDGWSPSIRGDAVSGRVVYVGDKTESQIQAMASTLRGAIVLTSQPQSGFLDADREQPGLGNAGVRPGNPQAAPVRSVTSLQVMRPLLERSGAAVTLRPSAYRDGTVGVTGGVARANDGFASIVLAAEQYNLLARLAEAGQPPELRVELRTRVEADTRTPNVIAEIPGTDPALRDEIVLVGAHLDSWHAAIGATDNGDGAIAAMEAMRILSAVGARPRRTIRVALWSGEEQGLLGARAYLDAMDQTERERLSVFLNDDPGSGRSLGFYMQDNAAAKAIFDAWLEPLADLDVGRNVIEGIGSTDHVPFDEVGLPAFTVIKDFEAYDQRTRHTNADFPERMSAEELSQSAILLAHFAWQAAQRDQRIPRRPVS